jgi:ATP synthase protein I
VSDSAAAIARPVFRIVALQLSIAVLFSALVAFFAGEGKGWSAAMGGGIAVLGSVAYALIVVRSGQDAKAVFRRHFRAEMVKMFVTAVLFVMVLVLFPSAAQLWLILGFAVTTLAYWFSLLAV